MGAPDAGTSEVEQKMEKQLTGGEHKVSPETMKEFQNLSPDQQKAAVDEIKRQLSNSSNVGNDGNSYDVRSVSDDKGENVTLQAFKKN